MQQSQLVHCEFIEAAYNGSLTRVMYAVLNLGADVNQVSQEGNTPVFLAVSGKTQLIDGDESSHEREGCAVVRFLAEHGADLCLPNSSGFTPLLCAALAGDEEMVCCLLELGVDINQVSNTGETPVFLAVTQGDLSMTRYLVERGADLDQANNHGLTPLCFAVHSKNEDLVRCLAELGASLNPRSNETNEEHGTEINQCNLDGLNPLFNAVSIGNEAMICCLVELRADVNVCGDLGITPLHLAASFRRTIEDTKMLRLLVLRLGADVNRASKDGFTAVYMASANGRNKLIQCLVEDLGADIYKADNDGMTPLAAAVCGGYESTALLLASFGADTSQILHDFPVDGTMRSWLEASVGWSKLHHACFAGLPHRVHTLLLDGADDRALNGPFGREVTPLELAKDRVNDSNPLINMNYMYDSGHVLQLMETAQRPWAINDESLFPPILRGQARYIQMLGHRLSSSISRSVPGPAKRQRIDTSSEGSSLSVAKTDLEAQSKILQLPNLPSELWQLITAFVVRRCDLISMDDAKSAEPNEDVEDNVSNILTEFATKGLDGKTFIVVCPSNGTVEDIKNGLGRKTKIPVDEARFLQLSRALCYNMPLTNLSTKDPVHWVPALGGGRGLTPGAIRLVNIQQDKQMVELEPKELARCSAFSGGPERGKSQERCCFCGLFSWNETVFQTCTEVKAEKGGRLFTVHPKANIDYMTAANELMHNIAPSNNLVRLVNELTGAQVSSKVEWASLNKELCISFTPLESLRSATKYLIYVDEQKWPKMENCMFSRCWGVTTITFYTAASGSEDSQQKPLNKRPKLE